MNNNPNKEWDKENMRTVSCRLRKEDAVAFKNLCASKGTTVHAALSRYIRTALQNIPIDTSSEGQNLVNQNIALRQKLAVVTQQRDNYAQIAKQHEEIIDLWLRSADRKL